MTPFPYFRLLAPELQNMVWDWAARNYSRIVEVSWRSGDGFSFHNHPPPLLSVCKRSRDVSWNFYHSSRITRRDTSSFAYFNYDTDVLYFPYRFSCPTSYGLSLETFLAKLDDPTRLRHLALCMPEDSNWSYTGNARMQFLGAVQKIARRGSALQLIDLYVVLRDEIMSVPGKPPSSSDQGVTQRFVDVKTSAINNYFFISFEEAEQYLLWALSERHMDRAVNGRVPPPRPIDAYNSWGSSLKIHWKIAKRRLIRLPPEEEDIVKVQQAWEVKYPRQMSDHPVTRPQYSERMEIPHPLV